MKEKKMFFVLSGVSWDMTKKISEFPQGVELQNSSMDPNV